MLLAESVSKAPECVVGRKGRLEFVQAAAVHELENDREEALVEGQVGAPGHKLVPSPPAITSARQRPQEFGGPSRPMPLDRGNDPHAAIHDDIVVGRQPARDVAALICPVKPPRRRREK